MLTTVKNSYLDSLDASFGLHDPRVPVLAVLYHGFLQVSNQLFLGTRFFFLEKPTYFLSNPKYAICLTWNFRQFQFPHDPSFSNSLCDCPPLPKQFKFESSLIHLDCSACLLAWKDEFLLRPCILSIEGKWTLAPTEVIPSRAFPYHSQSLQDRYEKLIHYPIITHTYILEHLQTYVAYKFLS